MKMKKLNHIIAVTAAVLLSAIPAIAHEGHDHDTGDKEAKEITVTGEVVDMACYIDHNATGPKHADCAKRCIASGLPVGIRTDDGKTYLLIGEHKPMNSELAEYAAKKITVHGKLSTRDGFNMIENTVIMK